jgi:hypothetical protein
MEDGDIIDGHIFQVGIFNAYVFRSNLIVNFRRVDMFKAAVNDNVLVSNFAALRFSAPYAQACTTNSAGLKRGFTTSRRC